MVRSLVVCFLAFVDGGFTLQEQVAGEKSPGTDGQGHRGQGPTTLGRHGPGGPR